MATKDHDAGIVLVRIPGETGHVFNVRHVNEQAQFWDPQGGHKGSFRFEGGRQKV